ncbi:ABC transporter ATP-binding protein [Saxibacter everestensis]|uniref:ABC transporter ATP-binding protein n=1 Tax=Saxibacter everestensis TaxID=2909229 RepID=A0ABY8QTS7_9MICO|nr:ABC transporter ATP-binding protein [Brevibacteriaceae bacterium ZFBP1038]
MSNETTPGTTAVDAAPTSVALRADGLRVATSTSGKEVLHGVSFDLVPGRILALVGESGSGKTTAGLACLGHFRQGLSHTGGSVRLNRDGEDFDVLALPESRRRALRGGSISYVPQDPALSLNPAIRVGDQILEVLQVHGFGESDTARRQRISEVLDEVGLPSDSAYQRRYPHQLSGGQQQRIGIAMAFACRPSVMVLDEPTTGLDVTTQALVLRTIDEMTRRHSVAGLYITHDLAVVAEVADQVAVMLSGNVVELGDCQQVLYSPQHRYTRRLLRAVPDLAGKRSIGEVDAITGEQAIVSEEMISDGVISAESTPAVGRHQAGPGAGLGSAAGADASGRAAVPREAAAPAETAPIVTPGTDSSVIRVRDLQLSYGELKVLDGISFQLNPGESMMLLGESGSGKTTLSRCVAGLNDNYSGEVALDGTTLARGTRQRTTDHRRRIQYVFQSPFSSLNPRRTIAESVEVPLRMNYGSTRKQRRLWVLEALDQVKLGASFADRRPGELSGGERQRAAIARALVNAPSVLVCDEVTSALDVSVQASIIDLLRTLQLETGMAMLFVTHNIALARHISQSLAVLQKGKIVDVGATGDVLDNPQHEYTQQLIANVPSL